VITKEEKRRPTFLPGTLRFKLAFWLVVALTLAVVVFAVLIYHYQRKAILQEAVNHVAQVSEVITRSTRYAMLRNQSDYVFRIIQDVARQNDIVKVRVFSKDGRIIHSTLSTEIGQKVDREAEGCVQCHRSEKPLEQLARSERSRLYEAPNGERLLGSMEVIRNEPSCFNASCHEHSASQSVLGVLDIVYSLRDIDKEMRKSTITVIVACIGFVMLVAVLVSVLVRRFVYLPLHDLESGAERLAAGDLDKPIPVRSGDEFGQLAKSFNAMTESVQSSRTELQEWNRTLEQKVEQRTHELRVAEAERARGDKLASVGLLAAGVAHELNNPLTGILTFSHLLRRKLPDDSADAQDLDLVIQETKRCAAIIKRLLDFAREKKPEKKFVNLNQVIEETVRIVERPAHVQDIDIALELDRSLPEIWIDEDQIKQVIMNMVVNARHAIAEKGRITVQTRRAARPKRPDPESPPTEMIEIAIVDTGCGIPEKDMPRIFDPFFTSKELGKGTGLGLSVSHGIVRAHRGVVEVESEVGKGTTFHVFLPIAPEANEATKKKEEGGE